jgi:hypothetical protein
MQHSFRITVSSRTRTKQSDAAERVHVQDTSNICFETRHFLDLGKFEKTKTGLTEVIEIDLVAR